MSKRIAHPKPGQPEFTGDSFRAIDAASEPEIDLNILFTKADPNCPLCRKRGVQCVGHQVGQHWRRPLLHGWHDPLRRIPRDTDIAEMTLRQAQRLIAVYRGRVYRMRTLEALMRRCARRGVDPRLEPKGDPRYQLDWPWQHIVSVGEDVGCTPRMYALRNSPTPGYGERVVPVARRNGVPGVVIH